MSTRKDLGRQQRPGEPRPPHSPPEPEIFPAKSPEIIPEKTSPEIQSPPDEPGIQPAPSPDATPPNREFPPEIQPDRELSDG
jgi:hypothetical protein